MFCICYESTEEKMLAQNKFDLLNLHSGLSHHQYMHLKNSKLGKCSNGIMRGNYIKTIRALSNIPETI